MIRTRFAPSPTGNLHIGGARTCLFNWLFARANNGKFILRIEDTDKARSKQEYLDEILNSLKWLGFDWDELYFQSKRFALYSDLADKLLKQGKAYEAEDGSGAIILKMPQKIVEIDDLIHGKIQFDTATIKDQVLIKSDKTPTYNFACVVDDADLKISHVIRGDDHISNTPKQIVIYEALGFALPAFAHIPMILSGQGGRLSKRTGATAISEYRNMGFLAEATVNYLSLLGWSPGDNQEIISKEESVKKFSIKDVNHTAAAFNLDKFQWINNYYLKNMDSEKLLDIVLPLFKQKGYIKDDNFDRNWLIDLIKLFKERVNTVCEIADWSGFFFAEDVTFSPEAETKLREKDLTQEFIILRDKFASLDKFDHSSVENVFRQIIEKLNIKSKVLIHPLRAAVTGLLIGPGIFEVIALLGKDKVCKRLDQAIKLLSTAKGE
ncbi:MAG: glutamate--tRNA ligase [Candidatus Omnitrophica bacterium]|nr:glutamate--tRNA ligase [Candidatus Omnitrophota bacterium]MDD5351578.1 glutamate--tRNA ligase [Candidatus Omnitrophota bacterium]MDD5551013.1 glutamate--tRNA ligase [Candidatus Omnitrophota bacterium]